jgi:hypothetical protein
MVFEPDLVRIQPATASISSPRTRATTRRASRACCRKAPSPSPAR